MEIWKTIPGFENYQASTLGKIRSLKYLGIQGKIQELKLFFHKSGYLMVNLLKNGIRYKFGVHQLIGITFLDYDTSGHEFVLDHINNNPLDNRLENLQIITHRKNCCKDIKRNLPTGVDIRGKKFRARIDLNGNRTHLGYFFTPEQASAAYQKALLNPVPQTV